MIEAVADIALTLLIVTIMLMLLTAPGWIAGQVVARKTRVLPVPFFFRSKAVRWTLWYFNGITSLVALVLATRPVGTFEGTTRLIFLAVALAAFAAAMVVAFYVGWTSAAKRLSRRGDAASAPLPVVGGWDPQEPQEDWRMLGQQAMDEYAPAQPQSDDGYRPAAPRDQ